MRFFVVQLNIFVYLDWLHHIIQDCTEQPSNNFSIVNVYYSYIHVQAKTSYIRGMVVDDLHNCFKVLKSARICLLVFLTRCYSLNNYDPV